MTGPRCQDAREREREWGGKYREALENTYLRNSYINRTIITVPKRDKTPSDTGIWLTGVVHLGAVNHIFITYFTYF